MDNDQIIDFDKRSFLKMLWHSIYINHEITYSFFYTGIFEPFHFRICFFFMTIYINFCFNAIFFSDELIESRNIESNKVLIAVSLKIINYKLIKKLECILICYGKTNY